MLRNLLFTSILAGYFPGFGLDIAGKVVDKKFAPLAGAKVCAQNQPAVCVLSGPDGTFRFQGNVGLRGPALAGPEPMALKIFNTNGRRVASDPGGPAFTQGSAVPRADRLAKGTAPAALLLSKSGYATTVYQPIAEIENGIRVLLGGEGETVIMPFNGKTLADWTQIPAASWVVKDGAMSSTGAGRGVIYFKDDFADFRVIFSVRQVKYDHWPCILFVTTRPPDGQKGLDALGGVQWQAPSSNTWDYRPGKNNSGSAYYTQIAKPAIVRTQWAQCELLVNSAKGEARMASCQQNAAGDAPCKAVEILRFKDPAAIGKKGPFAIQMHNGGIIDEYKDISIEVNPKSDSLYLTR
jgi:hypothetical protein